jgi:hypothetical protein
MFLNWNMIIILWRAADKGQLFDVPKLEYDYHTVESSR